MKLNMSVEMGASSIVLNCSSTYTLDSGSPMIGRGMGTRTVTFESAPGNIRWIIDFLEGEGIVMVDFTWGKTISNLIVSPEEKSDEFAVDLTYDAATETSNIYLHFKS